MQDLAPLQEAIKAAYSFGTSALVLCLGWFIGLRLTYAWNMRQKRREFQLSSAQQFYLAYGEFFAVWKLWNRLDRAASASVLEERSWELHKRAAAAEAIIEGTLVKLSSELRLSDEQLDTLGCFRQAFQQLREAIREGHDLAWDSSEAPKYKAFKTLAVNVSILLGKDWPKEAPCHRCASRQLMKITSNEWEKKWFLKV